MSLSIKGFKIISIIKVTLDKELLKIFFNLEKEEEKLAIEIEITDDGETISFNQKKGWVKTTEIKGEVYKITKIEKSKKKDKLSNLIGNEIKDILYGVGITLKKNEKKLYYFQMLTNKNKYLFFNNGDQGEYSLNNIEEILSNDIYECEWTSSLPTIQINNK